MSGRRIEVLVAAVVAGATFAIAAPAGAQAASSHPAMAKKAARAPQGTMKVKEETPGLAAQATISADSAQKIALGQVSRGWVREAELEQNKGTLVYSYDIKARGKSGVEEVLIDAKTGAVVSKTHETAAAEAKEAASEKKATKSSSKSAATKSSKKSSNAKMKTTPAATTPASSTPATKP